MKFADMMKATEESLREYYWQVRQTICNMASMKRGGLEYWNMQQDMIVSAARKRSIRL
jgi:hypothetical protein